MSLWLNFADEEFIQIARDWAAGPICVPKTKAIIEELCERLEKVTSYQDGYDEGYRYGHDAGYMEKDEGLNE